MKRKAVICDLDNTLTNANHRTHLLTQGGRDWDTFFALAVKDTVNQWCVELMQLLQSQGYEIIFVTGRPSFCQQDTEQWIASNTPFTAIRGVNLFMRPNNDRRADFVVKEEILQNLILPNYEIFLAVDDKEEVVKMWRNNGITALYCGDFPKKEKRK